MSKRTIYRDMAALSEMGVPIVSLPGEGYELMEGYYLPPLIFTPAEASALFLGAQLLIGQAAGQLPVVADQALSKLAAILPPTTRAQVDQLTGIIQFILPPERFDLDDARLMSLQRAIVERRVVHLIYHSHSRNEVTERDIEPHNLAYYNGIWYVNGYCRLREGPARNWRTRSDGTGSAADRGCITKALAGTAAGYDLVFMARQGLADREFDQVLKAVRQVLQRSAIIGSRPEGGKQ